MSRAEFLPLVEAAAREYGLPFELLAAQTEVESNWNPRAVSPAGARGLAQFMPETGARYGLKTEEDFFNPTKSIYAQAKHMRDLVDRYGGDFRLALAAYNAGPGAVDKYGGVPPYEETRNYVDKTMGQAQGTLPPTMNQPPTAGRSRGMPPEMFAMLSGAGIDLSPIGAPPEPERSRVEQIFSSPLVQIGLGILSQTPGNPLGPAAAGVQQGLLNLEALRQASAKRRQDYIDDENKRRQQQLYRQQNLMNLAKMTGMGSLNPWQRVQQEQQERERRQEHAEFERDRYGKPQRWRHRQTGETMTTVWDKDTQTDRLVTPQGVGDSVEMTGLDFEEMKATGGRGGAEVLGDPDLNPSTRAKLAVAVDQVDVMLEDALPLIAELEKDPSALGTWGAWSEKAHNVAQLMEDATGGFLGAPAKRAAEALFGEKPAGVKAKIRTYVLPIARALVDSSGPLAQSEQVRANQLLGNVETALGAEILGSEQALELLRNTIQTARAQNEARKALLGRETTPPGIGESLPAGGSSSPIPTDEEIGKMNREQLEEYLGR